MGDLGTIFSGIADRVKTNGSDARAYNNDGIPYCTKCGDHLAVRMTLLGKERLLPVICSCRKKEIEEEERRDEAERQKRRIGEIRRNSLMDERFAKSRFEVVTETAENSKALKIAHRFCNGIDEMIESNNGIMFYGNVGTGKTLIAACIANELIDKGYKVIMTSAIKVLDSLGFGSDTEGYIQDMCDVDILILDDFGAERKTDYAYEIVYNIIDSRYRVRKPLIITTNLPLNELTRRGDLKTDRIYDRVLEMCYPVEIPGVSWRMMMAKDRFEKAGKKIMGGS